MTAQTVPLQELTVSTIKLLEGDQKTGFVVS